MPEAATKEGPRILHLWGATWILALFVGGLVVALGAWCMVVYRRRGDAVPAQLRYNVPIEVLYTVVPFVIVAVLFFFTARDQHELNKVTDDVATRVEVTGFQWSWQFDYGKAEYGDQGVQVIGRPGRYPELVLPVNERVQFKLNSPDVIHSFWVVDFLYKRDVIPGRENVFEVTPNKTGVFRGKCAELCGKDHDRMLFTVRVVEPAEFEAYLAAAKAQPLNVAVETDKGAIVNVGSGQ
jgi:cytochrome c oxidase subunit 2